MDKQSVIKNSIEEAISLRQEIYHNTQLLIIIEAVANEMIGCFKNGGKVLFCGNGGSAADAQHLAAEFTGRYYYDRPPLFAEALHVNSSYLTAVANDYSYEEVFSRLVKGKAKPSDILVGLSTSGNSANVVKALETAKSLEVITVGFTGQGGGKMKPYCDHLIDIPSKDTPRIQECHMLIGHILCEIIERSLFPNG